MKNSKFIFDKISKLLEKGLISSKDFADELMNILKSKRDEVVFKMRLTSKDEFDILSKRVDALEKKVGNLNNQKKKKTKQVKKS
tara:strand:+ start:96 stop:347 length:252 start_codon:yes stop_codon:yes gene_type:complete